MERRIALAIGDLQEAMRELNGYAPPPGADFINLKNSSMVKDHLPLLERPGMKITNENPTPGKW